MTEKMLLASKFRPKRLQLEQAKTCPSWDWAFQPLGLCAVWFESWMCRLCSHQGLARESLPAACKQSQNKSFAKWNSQTSIWTQHSPADQYISQVFVRIYDRNIFLVSRKPFSGSTIYEVKVLVFGRRNITMKLAAKHSSVNCHIWILWGHPCAFQPTSAMVYSGNPLSFAEKSSQMQLPLKKSNFMQHLGNCVAERVRNELTTLGQVRSHEGWDVKLRRHEDMDRGTKSPF